MTSPARSLRLHFAEAHLCTIFAPEFFLLACQSPQRRLVKWSFAFGAPEAERNPVGDPSRASLRLCRLQREGIHACCHPPFRGSIHPEDCIFLCGKHSCQKAKFLNDGVIASAHSRSRACRARPITAGLWSPRVSGSAPESCCQQPASESSHTPSQTCIVSPAPPPLPALHRVSAC